MVDRDPELAALAEEEEGRGGKSRRTRLLVLAAVLVVAVGYLVYAAFPGNALFFLTVDEYVSGDQYQDGRAVRVSGKLVPESFRRPDRSAVAHFSLVDQEGGLGRQVLEATYVGVLPDLFFNSHSEIILEGTQGPDDLFHADAILVKCPSKYRSLQEDLQAQATGT